MIKRIEDFLYNRFAGRILARLAVTLAGYLAGQGASIGISVDPNELSAALIAGGHTLFEMWKAWRNKPAAAPAEAPKTP